MAAPTANHNSDSELDALRNEAVRQQIEAQRAWRNLLLAQLEHQQPWDHVMYSARMAGAPTDGLQRVFDVAPSTFSRWATGYSSPTSALRRRLSNDLGAFVDTVCTKASAVPSR